MKEDAPPGNEFEREKWLTDVELRRQELAIKEQEQANRNADIALKRKEQATSTWRSPLVVAILAATMAAAGNAVVAIVNGNLQRDLETRKRDAEIRLENSKAESTRILEMIKTGDAEKAAGNLEFLLKSGLITDADRAQRLTDFLQQRVPGKGPSLPAPDSRIDFETTESLTKPLQESLQKLLDDYLKYLDKVGFPAATKAVKIKVDNQNDNVNAYYVDDSIIIHPSLAADPSVPLHEYNHHVLTTEQQRDGTDAQFHAIETGLAGYFACSFLNNPKLGEKSAKPLGLKTPYIRLFANDRKFTELRDIDEHPNPFTGAEIWGGALWAIRERLGREVADPIIAKAWFTLVWPTDRSKGAQAFIQTLLASGTAANPSQRETVEAVLRARVFPFPP